MVDEMRHVDGLSAQFDFWSLNPCGTEGTVRKKMNQRYQMEPWIPLEIQKFPMNGVKFLEVGCGQGIDAFNICTKLDSGSTYTAIDYSRESIRRCEQSITEAKEIFSLSVLPTFRQADALSLPFETEEFDFVYSLGVLHHTPNPQKGIDEIHRVLKKGGRCFIVLYRFPSLKVGVAKFLRGFQIIVDKFTGRERTIYHFLKDRNVLRDSLGTMLLECFGVPWMHWFTRNELEVMFRNFQVESIEPFGFNFLTLRKVTSGKNPFGYFYKIEARKA